VKQKVIDEEELEWFYNCNIVEESTPGADKIKIMDTRAYYQECEKDIEKTEEEKRILK